MTDLTHPGAVMARLAEIEHDLATRQEGLEAAGLAWFKAKRDKEHKKAVAFTTATGTDGQRKMIAEEASALIGKEDEALWEASKAVINVLTTRASIGQSLLKAQGRA